MTSTQKVALEVDIFQICHQRPLLLDVLVFHTIFF